jgi:capsular exopolysaccharide synthesis family protein
MLTIGRGRPNETRPFTDSSVLPTAGTSLRSPASSDLALSPGQPWMSFAAAGLGETVRRIRARATWQGGVDGHVRTLAITSAIRGEGKTSIATALAISAALEQEGTVLRMEGDVTHPTAAADFGISSTPGLLEVLAGDADLPSSVQATRIPSLRVLTAGRQRPDTSRLLRPSAFSALLSQVREYFTLVVFDTPAILENCDAGALAQVADGTILVIRNAVTKQRQVRRAMDDLAKAHVLGAVVNGSDSAVPTALRDLLEC